MLVFLLLLKPVGSRSRLDMRMMCILSGSLTQYPIGICRGNNNKNYIARTNGTKHRKHVLKSAFSISQASHFPMLTNTTDDSMYSNFYARLNTFFFCFGIKMDLKHTCVSISFTRFPIFEQ